MRILSRALIVLVALAVTTLVRAQSFDLVIAGGRVIDPESGLDQIRHIGISGRTIAAMSADPLAGRATIDAAGLVVAPGFIDLHAHGQTPETYRYQARDGVTTALELEVGTADIERWYGERKSGRLINYGVSIGHIPVRMAVMGDSGSFLPTGPGAHKAATPAEIKDIARRIEDGLKHGAVSMGAGFPYTPAATQEELLEVFRVAGRNRAPVHVHIRRGVTGLAEALKFAGEAKAPLHVVHINSSGTTATAEMLTMIASARAQGQDVTTEAYPYTAGMTEIQSANLDEYQDAPESRVALLEWPRTGERLNRETFQTYRKMGGPVVIHTNTEEMVSVAVTSPLTMIASDAYWENGTGHPRTTGTYAKVLGRYVRESGSLSLMDAIRKMTLMPAERLQARVPAMRTKGRLRVGADADITVFDAAQIIDRSTYREPGLAPLGIQHVIVNGVPVVARGQVVEGIAPGQAVRGGQVAVPVAAAGSCDGLMSLKLPNTTITSATRQPASAVAESCRVAATLRPTSDSEIKMELWMPASGWNGKYQAVGNGAFNGNIATGPMTTALTRGYAASSTDGGHTGGGAAWAIGHPEKAIDFGYRAMHETAEASKKIIAAYYGGGPKHSYFNGCSAGGRQAMKAAQRFPADFDGIIAGAPGLDWTGRAAQAVRIAKHLEQNEAARLLAPQRHLLHTAVVSACDLMDGVKDGVIDNPRRCTFDPGVLECKGADGASCLTAPQVETARMIYSSAINPKTTRAINGLERGSELGWTDLGWTASARATGLDQFRFLVFGDATWTVQKFNWDSDIALAEERNEAIDALDPNLKPFISRGGKLISYHGWSDPQIAPAGVTQYYDRVLEVSGGRANVDKSYRLFMAPGMGHCSGGEGPNTFDMLTAIERWVEGGIAPDQITASIARPTANLDRSRPLCPYPQVAVYKGTGSTDEASNFACRVQ